MAARRDSEAQPVLNQRSRETQPFGTLTSYPLGLGDQARAASVDGLNDLLADAMTLRDLYKKHHWQLSGPTFHSLHLLFDKHAGEQSELVDEIAERIQTLGGICIATAHDVAALTKIERPPRGREEVPVQISRLLEAHELVLIAARALARTRSILAASMTTRCRRVYGRINSPCPSGGPAFHAETGKRVTMSPTTGRPIPFANGVLGRCYHVCAFFHGADEEYRVMVPFYRDGLQRGERCFHIVDSQLRADHMSRLTAAGIDVEAVERSGQLELRDWHQTYLREGRFDHGRMLATMQQILAEGPRNGYPLTRVMGHAEWSSGDWPGVKDLLKYEARLNDIISTDTGPVICVYNLSKLAAGLVIDVMRTHPMVVIGGVLQENPFYMPPEELLREFRERDV